MIKNGFGVVHTHENIFKREYARDKNGRFATGAALLAGGGYMAGRGLKLFSKTYTPDTRSPAHNLAVSQRRRKIKQNKLFALNTGLGAGIGALSGKVLLPKNKYSAAIGAGAGAITSASTQKLNSIRRNNKIKREIKILIDNPSPKQGAWEDGYRYAIKQKAQ